MMPNKAKKYDKYFESFRTEKKLQKKSLVKLFISGSKTWELLYKSVRIAFFLTLLKFALREKLKFNEL